MTSGCNSHLLQLWPINVIKGERSLSPLSLENGRTIVKNGGRVYSSHARFMKFISAEELMINLLCKDQRQHYYGIYVLAPFIHGFIMSANAFVSKTMPHKPNTTEPRFLWRWEIEMQCSVQKRSGQFRQKKEETGRKFSPTVKDLRPDAATALYVLCSMRGLSSSRQTRIKGVRGF